MENQNLYIITDKGDQVNSFKSPTAKRNSAILFFGLFLMCFALLVLPSSNIDIIERVIGAFGAYYMLRILYPCLVTNSQKAIFSPSDLIITSNGVDTRISREDIKELRFGDLLLPWFYFPLSLFNYVYPEPGIFVILKDPQKYIVKSKLDLNFSTVYSLTKLTQGKYDIFIKTGVKTVEKSKNYKLDEEFVLVEKELTEKCNWPIKLVDAI